MSRGATAFENFCKGVKPVDSDLGESLDSRRRTSESSVFVSVEVSVPVNVKSALGQIACPDSKSGLIPGDFLP